MAKSKIVGSAFSLLSEVGLDMLGMAVPGSDGVDPVTYEDLKVQEHYLAHGKTCSSKKKRSRAKEDFISFNDDEVTANDPQSHHLDPLAQLIAEEEIQSKMFPVSVFHVNKLIGEIKNAGSVDVVYKLTAQAELILIAMKEVFIGDNALQITLNLGDDLAIVAGAKKANLAKKTATVTGMLNGKKASVTLSVHA